MDQYPFEFNITVAGLDVEEFISLLRKAGLDAQANEVRQQFEDQLLMENL